METLSIAQGCRIVGDAMKAPTLPLWKLTRVRYDQMVDAGILDDEDRVELLDGLLVVREPQGSRHAVVVGLVRAVLERAFGRRYHVREEKPFALDDLSEPEPDLVVVPGPARAYSDFHPSKAVLVVEVADSSLELDRVRKGTLYARAGVADYWIVNLVDEVLEVYRHPRPGSPRRAARYESLRVVERNSTVTPLAAPRARVRVGSLLP
jgi:Uma2 family endonuclease